MRGPPAQQAGEAEQSRAGHAVNRGQEPGAEAAAHQRHEQRQAAERRERAGATPPSISAAPEAEVAASPTAAAEAAPKIAAQVAIVSGLEAVAASAVANARRGVATSSPVSPPSRTRKAAQSVRAPMHPSTSAPTTPSTTRSASISSRLAAPARPSEA